MENEAPAATKRLALITGASAGIGAAFARIYAAEGWDLALVARRIDTLHALGEALHAAYGAQVFVIGADLAEPDAPKAVMDQIAATGRHVDALVNNAGFGLTGGFHNTPWADQAAFVQLMVTAPAELAHRCFAGMMTRGYGRIINVASLAALTPSFEGHTLYAASKAFLIKMSESLTDEGRDRDVKVIALCPGLTVTEFHDVNATRDQINASTPHHMWQTAEVVARVGFDALEQGGRRPVVVSGGPNKFIAFLARILPPTWARAVAERPYRRLRRADASSSPRVGASGPSESA